MLERCVADGAVLGTWSRLPSRMLLVFTPLALQLGSIALLVCLMGGFVDGDGYNVLSAVMCLAWVVADALVSSGPYLVHERGRLTYDRVTDSNWVHVPPTHKGYTIVMLLVGDAVFLPLCLWASWVGDSEFVLLTRTVRPPFGAASPVVFLMMFWVVGFTTVVLALFGFCCLIPCFAQDPFTSMGTTRQGTIALVGAAVLAFLLTPSAGMMSSALPCNGETMAYTSNYACGSPFHRGFFGCAAVLLAVHFTTFSTLSRSLSRLAASNAITSVRSISPRCDPLVLVVAHVQRYVIVIGTTFFFGGVLFYFAVLALSLVVLVYTYSGCPSTVECLDFVFTIRSAQICIAALMSVLISLNPSKRFIETSEYWMTPALLLSAAVMLATYWGRYGMQVFANDDIVTLL